MILRDLSRIIKMPLSKKRNKDRMRVTRSAVEAHGATQVQPKVVQPTTTTVQPNHDVKTPELDPVQPKGYPTEEDAFDPILHGLTDSIVDNMCSVQPIPLYNPISCAQPTSPDLALGQYNEQEHL